ncbi:metalloregulator ArsR/SmtB family transcription factor [Clostridioides mangenotii]|uniref:ArsR/SmtB family transcription factor n=1 Tax=Metaclostridioides mangenotii TaxID=1540 RepID=UPI001C101A3C|nr:metalloregulator ArsR/SmtB family transcription factor [Clostridioides mangenotii]MBU5308510.1 metalloregulator ArsR/SmtB family transcription factor [Clostridioides mangenotii]
MNYSYAEYALLFKALSDETRLRILNMLSGNELCACSILEEVNITQPTLSYHMKILSECGLVNARKDGSWMKYTLQNNKILNLNEFLLEVNEVKENSFKDVERCNSTDNLDK